MNGLEWAVEAGFDPAVVLTDPEFLTRTMYAAIKNGNETTMLACMGNVHLPLPELLHGIQQIVIREKDDYNSGIKRYIYVNENILYKIARLGNLPEEAVLMLVNTGGNPAVKGVLGRQTISEQVYEKIWQLRHQLGFSLLTEREDLPELMFWEIAKNSQNRILMLNNPGLPQEFLSDCLSSKNLNISAGVLTNPGLPEETMFAHFKRKADGWEFLLSNPNLPTELIDELLFDHLKGRRFLFRPELTNLLAHPNLSPEALTHFWNWNTEDWSLDVIRAETLNVMRIVLNHVNTPVNILVSEIKNNDNSRSVWFNSIPAVIHHRKRNWGQLLAHFLEPHYGTINTSLPTEWLEELSIPHLLTPEHVKKTL